jgi:hypothetical protein
MELLVLPARVPAEAQTTSTCRVAREMQGLRRTEFDSQGQLLFGAKHSTERISAEIEPQESPLRMRAWFQEVHPYDTDRD